MIPETEESQRTRYIKTSKCLELLYRRRQFFRAQEGTVFRIRRWQVSILRQIILQHQWRILIKIK